jgi:hypothetical protein
MRWPEYAEYYVGQAIRCAVLEIDAILGTVVVSEHKRIDSKS